MTALVIDTTAALCAAALVRGGALLSARSEPMTRGHGERLFALIEDACRGADVFDSVVVCTGPGSFTGTRIGVSAARGIALARGVPAIGVDLFSAIASGRPGALVVVAPMRDGVALRRFVDGVAQGPAALSPAPPEIAANETLLDESALGDRRLLALAAAAQADPTAPASPLYLKPPDAAAPAAQPATLLS
jgi:tRNA threonylcarbamoyl adenosine modification protein YeaZ